ncbi:MAG: META domain-containing protein [Rariglobus sp.]|nr:META domain-containing protein [Rariglobus sp.]
MSARRLFAISLLSLGGLLALTGCGTAPSPVSGQDSSRTLTLAANTDWVLVRWTSAGVSKHPIHSPAPALQIGNEGRISGNAGVNRYTGVARITDARLNWSGNFALTRMAGPPELMAAENLYLDALQSTHSVTVRDDRLIFTGEKPLRLEFVRAKP